MANASNGCLCVNMDRKWHKHLMHYEDASQPKGFKATLWDCGSAFGDAQQEDPDEVTSDEISAVMTFGCHIISVHTIWGNWTAGDFFYPEENFLETLSETEDFYYRFITVESTGYSLEPSLAEASQSVGFAVCQRYGPIACYDPLPLPTVNMSFSWNEKVMVKEGKANYTCYPGYFAAWNKNVTQQTLSCHGILGGWRDDETDAPAIFDCYAMEVCNDLPLPPSPLIVNYTNENTSFVNGSVSYACPGGLAAGNKSVLVQTLTCVQGNEIKFEPEVVEPCDVCLGDPNVTNSYVIDYDSNSSYVINTTFTAMCLDGHLLDAENDSQAVVCTPDGWSDTWPCLPYEVTSHHIKVKSHRIRSDHIKNGQISLDYIRSCQMRLDQVRLHQMKSDYIRSGPITSNQVRSHQIASDDIRTVQSGQITSDHFRSGQVIARIIRSGQITSHQVRSDHIRPCQMTSDHQLRSYQITSNQVRSHQIRSNYVRSVQITSDQPDHIKNGQTGHITLHQIMSHNIRPSQIT
ncbi:uncharacterized protein [Penaeus vannamei]|uniref:uncharacterized protein n=1 Tax=Penaeus vannamei TaxID=6689 RepID=UPI00387F5105